MVRKSDRNKAGSSEKPPTKKATRSSRRRKKSTSESEPEPEPEIQPSVDEKEAEGVLFEAQPAETTEVGHSTRGRTRRSTRNKNPPVVETVELHSVAEEAKKEDEHFWNTDEAKSSTSKEEPAPKGEEATTWKIQSSNGAGGEIQKLKICRQRLTDSAESSSSPAKEAAAASPRRKRYRKRRKRDSERAESAESHTDSESTAASAVANIPASQEEDESHAPTETEMTVDAAVEQAEIAEAVESIKDLAPPVIEEEEEVMMDEVAVEVVNEEAEKVVKKVPEPDEEMIVEQDGRIEEVLEQSPVEERIVEEEEEKLQEEVVEEPKIVEKVEEEPTKTEEPRPVQLEKETQPETDGIEEGEIVIPKRRKTGKSEETAVKSGKVLKLSTEVAMEQIAKKLNERAALRNISKDSEDKEKKDVTADADTPASGISEEGEISPPKPTITVVKPNKPQDQTSKPPVLKRATESAPVQRRRRTSAKSKPKEEQIGISSTNLKLLVPEIEPVALDEVKEALLSTTATTIVERPAEEEEEEEEEDNEEGTPADDEQKVAAATPATEGGEDPETTGDGDDDGDHRDEAVTPPLADDSKTSTTSVSAAKRQKRLSGSKENDAGETAPKRKLLKEMKDGNVTTAREFKKKTPIVITHDDAKENKPERKSDENHKMVRKITLVSDDGKALRRSLSPVGKKQTPTPVLFITNLVRPFTVPQLRELLARTGTIAPNGFYIDKIKSKCYVKYDDVEMAIETRHALHGVRWPVNNPKTLRVEFSSDEAMSVVQKAAEDEMNNSTSVMVKYETIGDRDAVTGGWLSEKAALKPARRVTTSVREWDVGKSASDDIQPSAPPTAALPEGRKSKGIDDDWSIKDRMKDRGSKGDIDGRRRGPSPDASEPARKLKKRDTEAPAKLLDDLFKKTAVTPCIYWLPLTAEQIAVKEELRRQQFAEHERRLAELRKDVSSSRRDRDRSRDRDRERDRDSDRDRRKK